MKADNMSNQEENIVFFSKSEQYYSRFCFLLFFFPLEFEKQIRTMFLFYHILTSMH